LAKQLSAFTSPIRRYADLVVHRTLGSRNGKHRFQLDMSEIASIAEHISTTERTAADAEIDAAQMKKLEFFQRQLDQRNPQVFSRRYCRCPQLRVNGRIA